MRCMGFDLYSETHLRCSCVTSLFVCMCVCAHMHVCRVHLTDQQDAHFMSLSMAALSCNNPAFSRNFEHFTTFL